MNSEMDIYDAIQVLYLIGSIQMYKIIMIQDFLENLVFEKDNFFYFEIFLASNCCFHCKNKYFISDSHIHV